MLTNNQTSEEKLSRDYDPIKIRKLDYTTIKVYIIFNFDNRVIAQNNHINVRI